MEGHFQGEIGENFFPQNVFDLTRKQLHLASVFNFILDYSRKIASGMRRDSVAFLIFDFEREMGHFILGIYFPLNLVVACSWVAFWIVKTDVPARVALGVTTVLSVTKIGFGGKGKPQVGYSTALDIYIILCFIYTFEL